MKFFYEVQKIVDELKDQYPEPYYDIKVKVLTPADNDFVSVTAERRCGFREIFHASAWEKQRGDWRGSLKNKIRKNIQDVDMKLSETAVTVFHQAYDPDVVKEAMILLGRIGKSCRSIGMGGYEPDTFAGEAEIIYAKLRDGA